MTDHNEFLRAALPVVAFASAAVWAFGAIQFTVRSNWFFRPLRSELAANCLEEVQEREMEMRFQTCALICASCAAMLAMMTLGAVWPIIFWFAGGAFIGIAASISHIWRLPHRFAIMLDIELLARKRNTDFESAAAYVLADLATFASNDEEVNALVRVRKHLREKAAASGTRIQRSRDALRAANLRP